MHLSLKGSMDRQPLTDRLGDRLLAEYGGAAAAYSLRALNGNGDNVVRVRRASDNDEKDFTAEQIELGEMVNWVNSQTVPPLDIGVETSEGRIPVPEGGTSIGTPAAAYSLRNLSTTYTGNVVDVRRNSDGTEESFTAEEVNDGTLEAWVNTSFADALPLDTASGAAAAYSLRNLSSSYTGDVVEVRRSSDDAVESFTAVEVSDGTLEAWVGEEQVGWNVEPTWDLVSGDGVITSQSSTATTSTFSITTTSGTSFIRESSKPSHIIASAGDQVIVNVTAIGFDNTIRTQLRPSGSNTQSAQLFIDNGTDDYIFNLTDEAGYFNFLDVEATNGGTLTINSIKVIGKTGTVSKWYDQSGNTNHAIQGTAANQPKIVDGGSLVTGGIDFDGTDDYLSVNSVASALSGNDNNIDSFAVAKNESSSGATTIFGLGNSANPSPQLHYFGSNGTAYRIISRDDGNVISIADGGTFSSESLLSASDNGNQIEIRANGTSVATDTDDKGQRTFDTAAVGASDRQGTVGAFFDGTIKELIIYPSDQSSKRRAIEENIGATYSISVTFSKSGHVSKWYDQSGNNNHAVQTTAANQPKIVDAGVLITRGGASEPSILFGGGADNHFNVAGGPSVKSVFSTLQASDTNFETLICDTTDNTPRLTTYNGANNRVYVFNGFGTPSVNVDGATYNGTSSVPSLGFHLLSITSGTGGQVNRIGANPSVAATGNSFNYVSELIMYDSDQSDNRTALEANIGETYGISGIPAYDNTVDGFVETWYDQSGNGNDATQSVAASQPKIVDAGVLLNEIKFDGADDVLNFTEIDFSTNSWMLSAVVDWDGSISPIVGGSTSQWSLHVTASNNFSSRATSDSTIHNFIPTSSIATGDGLFTVQRSSDVLSGYYDGVFTDAAPAITAASEFKADKIGLRGSFYGSSGVKEIIIYDSDQSANRAAIETNINNHYSIYA